MINFVCIELYLMMLYQDHAIVQFDLKDSVWKLLEDLLVVLDHSKKQQRFLPVRANQLLVVSMLY